jgi:voltage-gated potassium channel
MSWLKLANLQDAPPSEIYVNALYWVITTTCTVGYGDFHPVTTNERIDCIACMLDQSGMFAYIVGDISRTVASFNRLATHFRERMNYVEQFLREKDIPVSLRQQVKRYLEYNWELKKLYQIEETELLSLLNDNLRGKIIVYFNGRILQGIDVLGRFPIEFLSNLSFIL